MRHAPRFLVFTIDCLITICGALAAFLLRYEFRLPDEIWRMGLPLFLALILLFRGIGFLVFKTHLNFVRYTSTEDIQRILSATTVSSLAVFLVVLLLTPTHLNAVPKSVVLLEYVVSTLLMVASRIVVRSLYIRLQEKGHEQALIFASEATAIRLKRALDQDLGISINVVGLFTTDRKRNEAVVEGIPLYPIHRLRSVLSHGHIDRVIVAKNELVPDIRNFVLATCMHQHVPVFTIPDIRSLAAGEIKASQLQKYGIEDLISRPPIKLSMQAIEDYISHKVVLVTGAAGSIGSEIVRQVARFHPRLIVLFDQGETPLYEIDLELREKLDFSDYRIVIGYTFDAQRLRYVFDAFHPQVVFHAAAYKHVPMMEDNPYMAIYNNVRSTKLLADLSEAYGVERFVMISTDKAVNPSNVMGASKRICEIYIQMLSHHAHTKFVTTRFGNVLGSNGSVVQRFKRQIDEGGPVTVTHPEIRRFFMTIPEACQLVLEAGTMGNGGEIFVFDMGKPEKIMTLAEKMIMLSGKIPNDDIKIVISGLRPGEKLYEEVLATNENTIPTANKQILRAKIRDCHDDFVRTALDKLLDLLQSNDDYAIVQQMKVIVPEFISKNSRFQSLDHIAARPSET